MQGFGEFTGGILKWTGSTITIYKNRIQSKQLRIVNGSVTHAIWVGEQLQVNTDNGRVRLYSNFVHCQEIR